MTAPPTLPALRGFLLTATFFTHAAELFSSGLQCWLSRSVGIGRPRTPIAMHYTRKIRGPTASANQRAAALSSAKRRRISVSRSF